VCHPFLAAGVALVLVPCALGAAPASLRPQNTCSSLCSGVSQGRVINVVEDCGATPDDLFSDSVRIQAALDCAESFGGGTVYVPPGNYLVDLDWNTALEIRSDNVAIHGDGPRVSILERGHDQNGVYGKILKATGGEERYSNIRMEGLGFFRGSVRLERIESFVVSNCEFSWARWTDYDDRPYDNGLIVIDSRNGTIENCYSHDNGEEGFYAAESNEGNNGGHLHFVNCLAAHNDHHGFGASGCDWVTYTTCTSTENNADVLPFWTKSRLSGFNIDHSRYVTYSGCLSTFNNKGFATYSQPSSFRADLFYDGCTAAHNERTGFFLGHAEGVSLSGCVARDNGYYGVQLLRRHAEKFTDFFSVHGGVVTGNGCSGIRVFGARYGTISGVTILNNGTTSICSADDAQGIRIQDGKAEDEDPEDPTARERFPSEGIVIIGCLITDDRAEPTQTTAILAHQSTREVFIYSNEVDPDPDDPDELNIVLEACEDCKTAHNVGHDHVLCDDGSCDE